jgi:serine/threonine protein kinase
MPAPATVADFLGLVSKSGLLEAQQIDGYLSRQRQAHSLPGQPAPLAAQLVRDGLLTSFQAEQLLNGRCRGFVLGKYRLLDRLGAGGMATVFLAEHVRMQRPVALKVLPSDRADDPACLGRFLREAQAAAALDHPNIVRAYDIETEGALCFLVMEYVDGVTLQELVNRRGRLEPARAAHYIRQAALGLEHAHQAGLVHRDIKPANLLVTRAGVVKILDMGLARFFQDESDMLTREHEGKSILGTADYLAPEQGRDSHDVDIRADLYSLGATFFYLLIGRPPFDGGTLNQKLIAHQMKPPMDVHTLRREIPHEMAALVAKMLAKDPSHRPQTPTEVAAALTPWTQTPLAPPSTEELPDPSPALRLSRNGPVAESNPTTSTHPDLVSPSRTLAKRQAGHTSPRPRRRCGWRTAVLLFLALVASGTSPGFGPPSGIPSITPLVVPLAPTRLRATLQDAGGIDLQWAATAGTATAFRIERAADRAFTKERTILATLPSGVNRYTDTMPHKSAPSCYRVFAVSEAGESAASNVAWPPPGYGHGFIAEGMVFNGGAALAGKTLRLTDGGNQARSAFYSLPLDVRAFTTRFRFRISPGNTADGFTFCIQGINPRRVGAAAGGLGYEGVGLSVALKFDLWNNRGEGNNSTGLFTGGLGPYDFESVDLTPSGIDLHSGRTYEVELVYDGRTLNATIRDVAEPAKRFRQRFPVDIPAEVQDTMAYVGFTGGSGGLGAVQDIVNWTWTLAEPRP